MKFLEDAKKAGVKVEAVSPRFPFQGQDDVKAFICTTERNPTSQMYIALREDGKVLDKTIEPKEVV